MQIVTKLIANLAVTTAKIADLAVTTGKIAANAVTGAKFRLDNDQSLRARNAADDADIDLVKVDATDDIQAQGLWNFATLPESAAVPASPDQLVNKAYADSLVPAGMVGGLQNVTLNAGNIADQYYDLAEEITPNTLHFTFSGVKQTEGEDYSLSLEGGVTRVTFLNDLATGGAAALVDGDKVVFQYLYQ